MNRFLLIVSFFLLALIFTSQLYAQSVIKDDFRVNDDTISFPGSPDIDVDPSGNFLVTWERQKNSDYNIYAQRFNSLCQPLGTNFLVNDFLSGNQRYPSLARDFNGDFIIVWQDSRSVNYDIYAQRYNSSGGMIGSNFKVNDNTGSSSQQEPVVDFYSNVIICWQDEREGSLDIFRQLYSSLGLEINSNLKSNDNSDSTQYRPSVAMDTMGNFIVVWQDQRNGNFDIYGQRYNSSGNTLGGNFKVNEDIGNFYQGYPEVACDNRGNFVVVWQDQRNGDYDIYAQRHNSSGVKSGVNFRINDDMGNSYQGQPDVVMDGAGNFAVVWKDKREGNYDIYAQRYSSNGNPDGKNYKVNNSPDLNEQSQPAVAANGGKIFFTWKDSSSDNCDIVAKVVEWNWTEVEGNENSFNLPNEFYLHQNYPNPFNGSTTIHFNISSKLQDSSRKSAIRTTVIIYNILGQRVRTLVDEERLLGEYRVMWDARDDKGDEVSSGIYFYKLKTKRFSQMKRMVLLK